MVDRLWAFAESEDDEEWRHAGPTRADAITEGTEAFEGRPFIICPALPVEPAQCFPSALRLIEDAAEHVRDEYGADDWPDLTNEQMPSFEADYAALISKYWPKTCPFSELIYQRKEHINPAGQAPGSAVEKKP